jgi:glycosyltransferase involved in cell wall biosynthesis
VGITVEKDDPEALATALGRLMADDGLRERMAENAHMTASGIMNWNRIAGELIREIERRSVNERN